MNECRSAFPVDCCCFFFRLYYVSSLLVNTEAARLTTPTISSSSSKYSSKSCLQQCDGHEERHDTDWEQMLGHAAKINIFIS